MAKITGTAVASPIVPSDDRNTHPTHLAKYGKGGWRVVASIAERDAIPMDRRESGMVVVVATAGVNTPYQLGTNLTGWSALTLPGSANADLYEDSASGISGTSSGDYFMVPDSDGLTLYRNVAGVATEVSILASYAEMQSQTSAAINAAAAAASSEEQSGAHAAEALNYRNASSDFANDALIARNAAVAAAEASGSVRFYDTYAEALADIANISANGVVEVFADETRTDRRTRYRKESGALVFKLYLDKVQVSIVDFGAVGDGSTDDIEAIQTAVDTVYARGGGDVLVPATDSYFRITKRIHMKSGVSLIGEGFKSFIKNDRTVSVASGDQSVIGIGGYRATGTNFRPRDETFYACNSITVGAFTITTTDPSDAGNFAEGDLVFVRNDTTDPNSSHTVYTHAEINEVVSADDGTGVVTLKYPHYDSTSTPYIAKSSGTLTDSLGDPIQLIKDIKVANLRLENYYEATFGIFQYGGCLGGEFENLYVDGSSAFSLNAMYRCLFSNIRGRTSKKTIDQAFYSGFNQYRGVRITQGLAPLAADSKVVIGECSHDTTITDCDFGAGNVNVPNVLGLRSCKRVFITNTDIRGTSVTGFVAQMLGTGAGGVEPEGCVLDNVRIYCGSPTYGLRYNNSAAGGTLRNTINNLQVFGTPTDAVGVISGSTNLTLDGVKAPSLTLSNASTSGTILMRNSVVKTQNYAVREALVTTLNTKGSEQTAKTYAIAQNSCSATGGWVVRVWGVATTDSGAATRFVRLKLGSTNVSTLNLETSMSAKSWLMEMTLINRTIAAQSYELRRRIGSTSADSTQQMVVGGLSVDFSAGAQDITLTYQLDNLDTSVVLRGWEVIPFGHDKK